MLEWWCCTGDSGDDGGGEFVTLLCESGGVIGQPGGKKGVGVGRPIDEASWARSWMGHDAMRAAAAAVWLARRCGARRLSAEGLKQA